MAERRFQVTREGEQQSGLAAGVDRRHLARLRRGEPEPEVELDLHGLGASEARAELRAELLEAHDEGVRVLRVVHGRGLRSDAGPVLKDGLVGWLTAPPVGRIVMAFTTAPGSQGGAGATLVLLRRRH